ncbi:MAG: hypothetical protein ACFFDI_14340 [Promethearchaeota archaeon]
MAARELYHMARLLLRYSLEIEDYGFGGAYPHTPLFLLFVTVRLSSRRSQKVTKPGFAGGFAKARVLGYFNLLTDNNPRGSLHPNEIPQTPILNR